MKVVDEKIRAKVESLYPDSTTEMKDQIFKKMKKKFLIFAKEKMLEKTDPIYYAWKQSKISPQQFLRKSAAELEKCYEKIETPK